MKSLKPLLLLAALLGGFLGTTTARPASAETPTFRVFDDAVAPMATEYARYGGPALLGPPVSRRFIWDGFVVQAFQKAVLQWRPDLGQAVPVNVLDEMARHGKDDFLANLGIPPHNPPRDEAEALARLDSVPELKAFILATPDWKVRFGLPTGVAIRQDFQVVRLQRAVLQRWLIPTPWAAPGDITWANVGDILRDAGLIPTHALQPEPTPKDWLERLNYYRGLAGLPPVDENPSLSAAAARHARYMLLTQTVEHKEDPSSPHYSPEGDQAARRGNIFASTNPQKPDTEAIDGWMNSPGHATWMINPALKAVGFGSHRDPAAGYWKYAATLENGSAWGPPPPVNLPILWHIQRANGRYYYDPEGKLCPSSGSRLGAWVIVIHREGETVTASAGLDGRPLETTVARPVCCLPYGLDTHTVFACQDLPRPGNYHFDINVGGRPLSLDFTLQ